MQKSAQPRRETSPGKLTDSHRLFLLVTANGSKLWRWSYQFDGKEMTMAFGDYPRVRLARARLALADDQHLAGIADRADTLDPLPLSSRLVHKGHLYGHRRRRGEAEVERLRALRIIALAG